MRFLYRGFIHDGETRSFTFQGIDEHQVETLFSIHVNLPLFARNKMTIQDAPGFCLELLMNECGSAPDALPDHQYTVLQKDFLAILTDREQREKLKLLKPAPRRVFRKPSPASQQQRVVA